MFHQSYATCVSFVIQFIGCTGSHWKQFIEYSGRNVGVTVDGAGHVNYIWNYDFGLQARGKFNYRLMYTITTRSCWQSKCVRKKVNVLSLEKSSSGNEVFSKMSTLNIHPYSVSVKVFGELINQWFQRALVNWQQFCSLALWKMHGFHIYTTATAAVFAAAATTTKNIWMEKFLPTKPKSRLVSFCSQFELWITYRNG